MSNRETKSEKLQHYKGKEPVTFVQLDGFNVPNGGDDIIRPDADGHCLFGGATIELMSGNVDVRVLVPLNKGIPADAVAAMLRKMANWIEREPAMLGDASGDLSDNERPVVVGSNPAVVAFLSDAVAAGIAKADAVAAADNVVPLPSSWRRDETPF